MAAAADTRQLQLQISASAELLIRNLKTADNAVATFQRQTDTRLSSIDRRFAALGKLKTGLGALDANVGIGDIAAAATGVTLISLAKRGLDYASSLGEVSQQLGVTTRDLQVYRYAASQAGVEQDGMDASLAKLTTTMGKAQLGAEAPRKAFDALGISLDDLKGKTAGDVIPLIAEGLSKITSPAQRAALLLQLFGKAGQQLEPLLAGGRVQIDEFAAAAERLGLVISDDRIQSADEAADKLAEVKQVLEAQIANVVAENAGAITALATSLGQLSGAVLTFLNTNPQAAVALLGALAGGRVGGPIGAAAGALAGGIAGESLSRTRDDQNNDLNFRRAELKRARDEVAVRQGRRAPTSAINLPGGFRIRLTESRRVVGDTVQGAQAEVRRQQGLLVAANAAAKAKNKPSPLINVNAPQILAPGGGGGGGKGKSVEQLQREREAEARKDKQARERADGQLRRAELDSLGSKADAAIDPDERLRIEQERIDLARVGRDRDLEMDALDNKYVAANLDRLKAINLEGAEIDKRLLVQRRAQQTDEAAFDRRQSNLQDEAAIADVAVRLAVIGKERRAIEQRILAIRQEEERLALERVANDRNNRFSPEERGTAQARLDRLPQKQDAERQVLDREQQGPIAAYRDQLVAATGDMDEALQKVAVNGFGAIEDAGASATASAITDLLGLGGVAGDVIGGIISDLARLAIQKAIVSAIGSSFFGFSEGGIVPGYAGGGVIRGPGTGTSDSILARVSAGEGILTANALQHYGTGIVGAINAKQLPRFATGGVVGGATIPRLRSPRLPNMRGMGAQAQRVEVDARVSVQPSPLLLTEIQATSVRTVAAAAEPIMAGAENRTMNRLNRPDLPGGYG